MECFETYSSIMKQNSKGEYILCQAVNHDKFSIAICLKRSTPFTANDLNRLIALGPLISNQVDRFQRQKGTDSALYEKKLSGLFNVSAGIIAELDLNHLFEVILQEACAVVDATRCSIYLVRKESDELDSVIPKGFDQLISEEVELEIVKHVMNTGKSFNIQDVATNEVIKPKMAINDYYFLNSALCSPIYSRRGKIIGCFLLVNKNDGTKFDEMDVNIISTFTVFCGIALENSNLFKDSLDVRLIIHDFVTLCMGLASSNHDKFLLSVIENSRHLLGSSRGTIFEYDSQTEEIQVISTSGAPIYHGSIFAAQIQKNISTKSFSRAEIFASIRTKSVPGFKDQSSNVYEPIICVPLVLSENVFYGVLELTITQEIQAEKQNVLETYAYLASVAIHQNHQKKSFEGERVEQLTLQWISSFADRHAFSIPPKLVFSVNIFNSDFDVTRLDGINLTKVLFTIFQKFEILEEFKITNEQFFHFITSIGESYNLFTGHDWKHAVEVTLFCVRAIVNGKLDQILSKLDVFTLLLSAICYDSEYDQELISSANSQISFEILLINQAVIETQSCIHLISTLFKGKNNLLQRFSREDKEKAWSNIFQLILSVDPNRHLQIIKEASSISESFNENNSDHILILMKLIIKCGYFLEACKTFELVKNWPCFEMEQRFKHFLESNQNDGFDEARRKIDFYKAVVIPLFSVTQQLAPKLESNTKLVEKNFENWNQQIEERKQEQEQERDQNQEQEQ